MTELNFGESVSCWLGKVVNIKDPHESGRVQVRIYGRHDDISNIPDESLPWALVIQPVTSAAQGRLGSAPVGLTKNSQVFGFWLDSDHQYPLIMGTIGKSGDIIPGQTENGAPAVDITTGSIPSSAQASTPHPYNPYSSLFPGRISIADIDSGQANIFSIKNNFGSVITKDVENLLAIPKVPTIGYIAPGGSSDALRLSRQVDPLGKISSLPCVPSLMISFFDLSSLVSGALAKVLSTVVNAMVKAFLDLAKKIGLFKLLQMLNQLASELRAVSQLLGILSKLSCVITPLTGGISAADYALARAITELNNMVGYVHGVTTAISSEIQATIFAVKSTALPASNIKTSITAVPLASLIVTQPPANFVQSYVSIKNDPFPGYIGWYDPLNPGGDKVYTLRNGQPNYNSAQEHLEGEMQLQFSKNISSGFTGNTNTIVSNDLLKTVDHTVTTATQYAAAFSIGIGLLTNPSAIQTIAAAAIADVINAVNVIIKTCNALQVIATTTTANPLALLRKIAKLAKLLKSSSHIGEQSKLAIKRQMFKTSIGAINF